MALQPAAWADEVLRERSAELSPRGRQKMMLLATGDAQAAEDAMTDEVETALRQGRSVDV
jgi:hypothetical protein